MGHGPGGRRLRRTAGNLSQEAFQLRVQLLELVLDPGSGLAADLLAGPLPACVKAQPDHPRHRPEQVL